MLVTQFAPTGATVTVQATNASATSPLPAAPDGSGSDHIGGPGDFTIAYWNEGTAPVFVAFGSASVTATSIAATGGTGSMPLPPGVGTLRVPNSARFIAYVARGADTPTLHMTPGVGS